MRDAIVIGGGFFGCRLALALARNGARVAVIEKESALLSRASFNNQARVHHGYHYPRSILTGLRIGWAFAWRTLIAAELVFGVSSGSGGLGWFIYENKNQLEIPNVFAGLLMVIVLGLLLENVIFRWVETRPVRRWRCARLPA